MSITDIAAPGTAAVGGRGGSSATRFYGKYRGIVVDVDDPRSMGRVRARVPEVLQDVESGWALPAAPYAGDGVGAWTIPPVDAAIWVEFEAGDPSRPIWTGGWWAEDQRPKNEKGTQAEPTLKILRSEQGLLVALDDDGKTISVSDDDGSNLLTIEVQKGQVTIKGATKAVVEAPQIELVENATHPVVFGDELMTYLNQIVTTFQSHMHPGETAAGIPVSPAPPTPPLPSPTPSLLSQKVKAG
jgi:uncharacterized protein involved in type VI secretion and phage assembly